MISSIYVLGHSVTCEATRVQSWTKGLRQIDKIKQNRFFYGMFYS